MILSNCNHYFTKVMCLDYWWLQDKKPDGRKKRRVWSLCVRFLLKPPMAIVGLVVRWRGPQSFVFKIYKEVKRWVADSSSVDSVSCHHDDQGWGIPPCTIQSIKGGRQLGYHTIKVIPPTRLGKLDVHIWPWRLGGGTSTLMRWTNLHL
jgi:hypothetical protein